MVPISLAVPSRSELGEQSQAGDPGLVSAMVLVTRGGTTGECLGLGRGGWTVPMSPKSWQRSAPGSLGPSQLWAPSPSCLHPCYLWVPRCVVRVRQHPECRLRGLCLSPLTAHPRCSWTVGSVLRVTCHLHAHGSWQLPHCHQAGGPQHIVGSPFKAKVTGELSWVG